MKSQSVDESIKHKIIENGESHSLDKGALDNLEDQSLPINSTPRTSKENAHLVKKSRQAKNRVEKLKSLKPVDKKDKSFQNTPSEDGDQSQKFSFEDIAIPSNFATGSKFFEHSPAAENLKSSSNGIPLDKSGKKRVSESPLSPKGRRLCSKSTGSHLDHAELGKSIPSFNQVAN